LPSVVSNTTSANYLFTPDAGQCASNATLDIVVVFDILPTFDISSVLCKGEPAPLLPPVSSNNITGTWTPTVINNTQSALYRFNPDAGQCAIATTLSVRVVSNPVANAGPDDFAEYNMPYKLSGSGGKTYAWTPPNLLQNPAIQNPVATLVDDATFILSVANEFGCEDVDSVRIKVLKGPEIYVPTGFTPNGDGLNDIFRPIPIGITSIEYFRVYNRYGELVFETRELNKGWDGNYKGIPQSSNAFIWQVKGTDRSGKIRLLKGTVTLIR
jgi:gliding motility-associated-like protein